MSNTSHGQGTSLQARYEAQFHQSPQKSISLQLLKQTLKEDPKAISAVNTNSWTWLHRAAQSGQAEIVEFLLAINIEYLLSLKRTSNEGDIGDKLKDSKAMSEQHRTSVVFVNAEDVYRRTSLHLAASHGTRECLEAMIRYQGRVMTIIANDIGQVSPELRVMTVFNLDSTQARGLTATMCAIKHQFFGSAEVLITAGANLDIQNDKAQTCLHMACIRLVSGNRRISGSTQSPTTSSASLCPPTSVSAAKISECLQPELAQSLMESVKLMIINGADVCIPDLYKENVLHYACHCQDLELLQMILHYGKIKQPMNLLKAVRALYKGGKLEPDILSRQEWVDAINAAHLALIYKTIAAVKGVDKMTTSEVCEWLSVIGVGPSTREIFEKNEVNGVVLQQISDETLRSDLKIESFAQRSSFFKNLQELKSYVPKTVEKPKSSLGNIDEDVFSPDELAIFPDPSMVSLLRIPYEKLVIGDIIGKGYFGEVRRGMYKELEVAIKTIYRTGGDTAIKNAFQEMALLSQLRHPNVLYLVGYSKHEGTVMLLTELKSRGALHTLIQKQFSSVPLVRHKILSGIVKGMEHIHSRRLVHRDLNTKNILLDDLFTATIADFGLSRSKTDQKMTMNVGFFGCMAPEVYLGSDYSEKADVFSFAMVAYELLTGKESHFEFNGNLMAYAASVANHDYRPPLLDSETSIYWNDLIRRCWDKDPSNRPAFISILEDIRKWPDPERNYTAPMSPVMTAENTYYVP